MDLNLIQSVESASRLIPATNEFAISRVVQGLGDTRTGPRMRRIRVDDVLAGIELPV
jgi:hypothetical protein